MSVYDDLRTKFTAIGDAIRSKTGGSDLLPISSMAAAIDGITVGGSGGGGGTSGGGSTTPNIENGYTINFYNSDGALIQSHSAIYGNWVDKPTSYIPGYWEDANKSPHQFPLVVDEDMGISVVNLYPKSTDDALYSYFGIDKSQYPYMMIQSYSTDNWTQVIFARSVNFISSGLEFPGPSYLYSYGGYSMYNSATPSVILSGPEIVEALVFNAPSAPSGGTYADTYRVLYGWETGATHRWGNYTNSNDDRYTQINISTN